jgi:hypothetical protein
MTEYFFRGIGGGLGDFLCNYASMKALSLDHDREFYLYGWNEFINWNHYTNPYIKRDTTGWQDLFKETFRFTEGIRVEHANYLVVELPHEPVKNMNFDSGPIHIGGFPFSNGYFEHRLPEIKDSFNIPNRLDFKFKSDDVVLNTRRGEYPGASVEFIDLCFTDYYLKALRELNPKQIYLVSDDTRWTWEWFNQTLKPHFPNVTVSVFQDKPIIQFEYMMKAPNLIICQSQFSRWAGILNQNNVFSPYKWYANLDADVRSYNLSNWRAIKYER